MTTERVAPAESRAPADPAAVCPAYGAGSLAELLPSVAAHLGVPGCRDVLGIDAADRVAVLLVDGLGWHLLREAAEHAPVLAGLLAEGRVLTAGFPTTTPTSLASLCTGLPAGAHGLLGFRVLVPGPERVMQLLRWDPEVDPLAFQPRPTVLERAEEAGVAVTTVGPRAFRGTGLTLAGLRGGAHRGADSLGELAAGIVTGLQGSGPSLVYGYHGDLDGTGHRNGWRSAAWQAELSVVDRLVGLVAERLPAGAVLHVTADHGMVDVPFDRRVDLAEEPSLQHGVELVAGEPRAVYLRTRAGAAADVVAAWRARLGDDFWVLATEEADAAGWFGGLAPGMAARVGDVVVAARAADVACIDSRSTDPGLNRLVGLHGSLTDAERHVPLLTIRG